MHEFWSVHVHIYQRDSVTTADFEVSSPISCRHSLIRDLLSHRRVTQIYVTVTHGHPDHLCFVTSPFLRLIFNEHRVS